MNMGRQHDLTELLRVAKDIDIDDSILFAEDTTDHQEYVELF